MPRADPPVAENPKQYLNVKDPKCPDEVASSGILRFEFRICFELRVSNFVLPMLCSGICQSNSRSVLPIPHMGLGNENYSVPTEL